MDELQLPILNFPEKYQFRLKQSEKLVYIFCTIRKKWLVLTPEEWVRQHVINYFIQNKNFSKSSLTSERIVSINGMRKRCDLLVFRKEKPYIIVECKAPNVEISQISFDQIARYNLALNAQYLMVTNGFSHFYCQMDFENHKYVFLEDLPAKSTK